jgi:opacity protein-like surface antigen
MPIRALVLAAALAGLATAAQAQALPAPRPLDLSALRPDQAAAYDRSNALRAAGVARTSVDHRFGRDDVTGSLGFLCGLQPRADKDVGAAHGYDPNGRFLGAKLSFAFR